MSLCSWQYVFRKDTSIPLHLFDLMKNHKLSQFLVSMWDSTWKTSMSLCGQFLHCRKILQQAIQHPNGLPDHIWVLTKVEAYIMDETSTWFSTCMWVWLHLNSIVAMMILWNHTSFSSRHCDSHHLDAASWPCQVWSSPTIQNIMSRTQQLVAPIEVKEINQKLQNWSISMCVYNSNKFIEQHSNSNSSMH